MRAYPPALPQRQGDEEAGLGSFRNFWTVPRYPTINVSALGRETLGPVCGGRREGRRAASISSGNRISRGGKATSGRHGRCKNPTETYKAFVDMAEACYGSCSYSINCKGHEKTYNHFLQGPVYFMLFKLVQARVLALYTVPRTRFNRPRQEPQMHQILLYQGICATPRSKL